ncbi:MAG: ATP-binding protein [Thermoplasmatota archaeon]
MHRTTRQADSARRQVRGSRTATTPSNPDAAGAVALTRGDGFGPLFQKTPTPLLVVDASSLQIVEVNEAATKRCGYAREKLLSGTSLADLAVVRPAEPLARLVNRGTRGLVAARSSWTISHPSGAALRLEVVPEPVWFRGRPCAILFQPPEGEPTSHDVGADAPGLPEFSFTALHDLKEPLHVIKGYLSLLRDRLGPTLDAESQGFLAYAFAGTESMQAIVANLLEYLRAETRGIAPEPVALDAVWAATVEGLRLQIHEAAAEVTQDMLPTLFADRVQVGRLLQNLLSNALKFRTTAPVHVHFGVTDAGDSWEFTLRDDGIGIDPKDQERILTPFQRVYSSDRFPGTGLGLSIAKRIVELHGGRFWIESQLGHGTAVHFTLPKGPPPRPPGAKGA